RRDGAGAQRGSWTGKRVRRPAALATRGRGRERGGAGDRRSGANATVAGVDRRRRCRGGGGAFADVAKRPPRSPAAARRELGRRRGWRSSAPRGAPLPRATPDRLARVRTVAIVPRLRSEEAAALARGMVVRLAARGVKAIVEAEASVAGVPCGPGAEIAAQADL